MKPNTTHEEYDEHYPEWELMEDVLEGEDEVHKKGQKYLPMLTGQTIDEYASYVMRAPFYNATARTVDGLIGMIFRKAPTIVTTPGMESIINDMTLDNTGLDELAEQVLLVGGCRLFNAQLYLLVHNLVLDLHLILV
jgi:hypothetical protein